MGKVLVAGSLNMDMVVMVDHVPVAGETILTEGLELVCGGKGANQAYTCGKLGAETIMLGSVGDDGHGEKLAENLRSAGVKTDYLQRCSGVQSGMAVIAVESTGNNSIMVIQGANLKTTQEYVRQHEAVLDEVEAVVMQLEIPLEAVMLTARLARKKGKLVVLDPAPARPLPDELLQAVDILKPNETELALLTGMKTDTMEQIHLAALALIEKGVKRVVVTLGNRGAMMVEQNGAKHFPGKSVKAVDTTAAGDSFTAAMTKMLAEGKALDEAIAFAIEVSALVVTRKGAQTSIPSEEEVAELLGKK